MQMTAEMIDGVAIVTLVNESLDAESSKAFKQDMEAHMGPGAQVVLDLSNVAFVDSAGLGSILSCLRKLNAQDGDLKLSNMSAPVRSMFELVRMHRVVEIHNTREDAIRAFHG